MKQNDERLRNLQPPSAVKEHLPLCFCLKHVSHYDNHSLPDSLDEPRVRFHDRDKSSEQSFYLNLLLILRADLEKLHSFTKRCLTEDEGPPTRRQMTKEEREHHLMARFCAFCGSPYYKNKRLPYPTVHHNHFLKNANSQTLSICSHCNLNAVNSVHKRVPLTLFTQNGSHYDLLLIGRMVVEYGHVKFPLRDSHGAIVGYKPLLRTAPKLLLKNSEQILSVEFRFNCLQSDCRPCVKRKARSKRQRRNCREDEACVFDRTVRCLDVMLITNSALQKAVQDMTLAASADNIPLQTVFAHTYKYARDRGLTHTQASEFCTAKMPMPFSKHFLSAQHLSSVTSPPPRHEFLNEISNSTENISEIEYQNFLNGWNFFNCQNLLELIGKKTQSITPSVNESIIHAINQSIFLFAFSQMRM